MRVGLLGLQGAFLDHRRPLSRLGCDVQVVRDTADLAAVDRLILPGGESTVMAMYLEALELLGPIKTRISEGMPAWGICAGAILLARRVDERPGTLGPLSVHLLRNAYGRQNASDVRPLAVPTLGRPAFPGIFIRAPRITSVASAVAVLARRDGDPVFVRQDHIMATTFHPELTDDTVFHEYFLGL